MRAVPWMWVIAVAACSSSGPPPDARPIDAGFFPQIDGPPPSACGETADQGCLVVGWQLATVDANGQIDNTLVCPDGFDTVAAVDQKTSSTGVPVAACDPASPAGADPACIVDLFPCNFLMGQQIVPRGFNTQYLAIANHDGTSVYARSPTQFQIVTGAAGQGLFTSFIANGGYPRATWQLVRDGQPASCQSAGSNLVVEVATPVGAASFPCDAGGGPFNYLPAHPSGTFAITAQLVDATGSPIGTAATANVTVGMQDDLPIAGPIMLGVP